MRIGELSKRTGVATSRIRFYERQAVLPRASRGPNGYRMYPETAVKRLRLIDDAQRLGFTLSEIREALSDAAPHFPSREALIMALRGKLESLEKHIDEAQDRRRRIVELLTGLDFGR